VFSPFSEVLENPTGLGRGFSPQLGYRCFPRKNTVFDLFTFLLISAAISVLDELQTPCPNRAYACFQKLLKIYQHNSPPLVFVFSQI